MLANTIKDLHFAFRMIRRSPGFAALAVFCLALGIGASTSVFSWIEGILLRPFPLVHDQNRLFVVGSSARGASRLGSISTLDMADFARQCATIESFIAARLVATTLSIGERADRAVGEI